MVNHQLSKRLTLGATWTFASGGTMTIPERQTQVLMPDGSVETTDYSPSRNNYRLPPSHRLNLSLNHTKFKDRGEVVWSFGVYNAYDKMNPNFVMADYESGYDGDGNPQQKVKLTKITMLPIIPSVSFTRRF